MRIKVQFIVPPLHPRSLADTFHYLAGVLTTDTCMRRQFNNNTHGKMEICHFDIATMDNVGCSYIAFAETTDCSGLSLTEVPEDIPISTLTLLLDDNAFTVLESGMFSNLPLLQALSLVRFSPPLPLLPSPPPPSSLLRCHLSLSLVHEHADGTDHHTTATIEPSDSKSPTINSPRCTPRR